MFFPHIFNYQHVYTFNMLKSLLIRCILETHGIQCFAIIFEWFSEFFHISWTINIFTWVESSTLNLLKPLFKLLHIATINIYWNTHNNLMPHIYTWIFSRLLNYQHLHMSWIIHFECVKPIIHKLHFAFTTIFWVGYKKLDMFYIYIWMG